MFQVKLSSLPKEWSKSDLQSFIFSDFTISQENLNSQECILLFEDEIDAKDVIQFKNYKLKEKIIDLEYIGQIIDDASDVEILTKKQSIMAVEKEEDSPDILEKIENDFQKSVEIKTDYFSTLSMSKHQQESNKQNEEQQEEEIIQLSQEIESPNQLGNSLIVENQDLKDKNQSQIEPMEYSELENTPNDKQNSSNSLSDQEQVTEQIWLQPSYENIQENKEKQNQNIDPYSTNNNNELGATSNLQLQENPIVSQDSQDVEQKDLQAQVEKEITQVQNQNQEQQELFYSCFEQQQIQEIQQEVTTSEVTNTTTTPSKKISEQKPIINIQMITIIFFLWALFQLFKTIINKLTQ